MRRLGLRLGLMGVAAAALLALLLLSPAGGGGSALAGGPGNCPLPQPVPIPDLGKANVDCTVTDPGAIKDLDVVLVINHTFASDLDISLTHVDTGTTVLLVNRSLVCFTAADIVLDDEATDPVGTCNGTFIPDNPLSAFDGESFAGTWRLTVLDQAVEDEGSVKALALIANTNHGIKKVPRLANLWLCNQGNNFAAGHGSSLCDNKASGVEGVNLNVELNEQVIGTSPKGEAQSIGSFEFEVRYDAKFVSVTVGAGEIFRRRDAQCTTNPGEGFVQFRCNIIGKPADAPAGPGTLAVVHVRPTADDYSFLIANQQNGIATQLINQDCNLSDLQGHPIVLSARRGVIDPCPDADVTIRYLEGDIHADCVVDVLDQQQIAFRWGSRLGNLLYNSRMDLEPSAPKKGDGDIDAKDLQFVYGRHGSTCKDPHPAQDPVDPKAKPPTPAPPFAINLGEFVGTEAQCGGPAGTDTVTAIWDGSTGNPAPSILLQKLGPTANCAAAFADIKTPLEGGPVSAVTELNFDVKQTGHCGNGSPRFNLELNAASNAFLGCNFGGTQTDLGNGWTHVEFSSAQIAAAVATAGGLPTDTLTDLYIISDEGDDTGPDFTGTSNIDNISVNGDVVGSP